MTVEGSEAESYRGADGNRRSLQRQNGNKHAALPDTKTRVFFSWMKMKFPQSEILTRSWS